MSTAEPGFAELRDHLARSWPASERVRAGGWLLRATPGLSRGRLNSALPLVVDPDLTVVEDFYARRGLPAQVQVTPLGGHPRLVAELDARGWASRWKALVMAAPADGVAADTEGVTVGEEPSAAWLEAWSAGEGRSGDDVGAHAAVVFSQLRGRAGFARDSSGSSVGLGVAGDGLCALFCVATRPARRRRGLAAAVVGALSAWGIERGARWLCLEVQERNEAAVRLYERLGFTRRYAYVHRAPTGAHSSSRRPAMRSRYQRPERFTVRAWVS